MPCRRLRYYAQYMPPTGLASVQLYGVYAATERDMDAEFYRSAARSCLDPGGPLLPGPSPDDAALQALLNGDAQVAAEQVLGMRVFMGGISHAQLTAWRRQEGVPERDVASKL